MPPSRMITGPFCIAPALIAWCVAAGCTSSGESPLPIANPSAGAQRLGDSLRAAAAARVRESIAFPPEPAGQGAAARLEEFGVLVGNPDRPNDDTGSFFFISTSDPQLTPRELGFIRAADLLDAGARFTAIGDAGPLPMLASAAPQRVDSAFRAFDDVCTVGVPVPVRQGPARSSKWLIGLAAGGGVPFMPGAWQRHDGSAVPAAYAAEAMRLIAEFPGKGAEASPKAFSLATVLRTVADGVEILVVDARRDVAVVHAEVGNSFTQEYVEQRFVIAERDSGAVDAPFRSAYTAVGNDASDWAVISTPALFLRMGSRRLLALHSWIGHPDGGGGVFIARVAPGRWSRVAGWAAGC